MRSSWPTRPIAWPRLPEMTMTKRPDAPPPPAPASTTPSGDAPRKPPRTSAHGPTRPAVAATAPDGIAFVEPLAIPIQKATDLGSVQVLKHGNLYLLTDPFGDIHPDSRGLGLYDSDTRLISCCALRVGGERPVLLQGSMGANYRGSIQLTNPSADRNQDAKVHPLDQFVGRTIGVSRDRLIGVGGLEERLRIVNHAEQELAFSVELELGADSADIFEVRGYPRPHRGTLLPIAITPARATVRYDGL